MTRPKKQLLFCNYFVLLLSLISDILTCSKGKAHFWPFRAPSTSNYSLEKSNTHKNNMPNYSFSDSITGKAADPLTKANQL